VAVQLRLRHDARCLVDEHRQQVERFRRQVQRRIVAGQLPCGVIEQEGAEAGDHERRLRRHDD
jgi:hypothetical protein